MGAQVAVPMAAGVVLAAALILAGLGRWLAFTRPSQQRLTRFAPPVPVAADAPAPRAADGFGARLARLLDTHPGTLATGALAVLALAAGLLTHAPGVGLVAAVALALLALWQFSQESTRRRERLEEQLGPAVRSMAAAIDSGYNVQQAIERVANESPPPLGDEFARVVRMLALGESMETALSDLAARAHSSDVDFFATVVGIQFRLGGDLGTLLLGLATSIQERLEFRGQVRALTAQPRLSARVLIVLPLVSLVLVYVFNRPYLEPLLSTRFGHLELALAAVLLAGGIATIQAMSEVRP